jgi:hypothetical protein
MPSASSSHVRTIASPRWVPLVIVALILAPVLILTSADPDLWGHVRFGLDMLSHHTLPRVDPYSFTQDVPWVNHEWLSELLMGVAYQSAGAIGLALLKGTLVVVVLSIVLSSYSGVAPFAFGAVVILLAGGTGRVITTLRPQLWTLIGVALLCRFLITMPRRWWLAALPLLFVCWVNLHGGWIVGAGLLAVWTAFQLWRPEAPRALIAGVALLSALGTLINPYGWRMWEFLGATVRLTRPIAEWQPLWTTPVLAWIPWGLVLAGVAASTMSVPRARADRIAMIALLAYASFRVERLAPVCVVAAIVLMSPTVLARWRAVSLAFDPISRTAARGLWLAVVALAVGSGMAVARTATCISMDGPWIPDRAAGRALVASKPHGKIVTFFDWGEYAIWHLSPSLQVSIDGRRETVYSETVLEEHDAMNAGTPDGIAYLQRLDPEYVWLPARFGRLRGWLETHGYRIDLHTEQSFVAVRADQPPVTPNGAPEGGCFPGP